MTDDPEQKMLELIQLHRRDDPTYDPELAPLKPQQIKADSAASRILCGSLSEDCRTSSQLDGQKPLTDGRTKGDPVFFRREPNRFWIAWRCVDANGTTVSPEQVDIFPWVDVEDLKAQCENAVERAEAEATRINDAGQALYAKRLELHWKVKGLKEAIPERETYTPESSASIRPAGEPANTNAQVTPMSASTTRKRMATVTPRNSTRASSRKRMLRAARARTGANIIANATGKPHGRGDTRKRGRSGRNGESTPEPETSDASEPSDDSSDWSSSSGSTGDSGAQNLVPDRVIGAFRRAYNQILKRRRKALYRTFSAESPATGTGMLSSVTTTNRGVTSLEATTDSETTETTGGNSDGVKEEEVDEN